MKRRKTRPRVPVRPPCHYGCRHYRAPSGRGPPPTGNSGRTGRVGGTIPGNGRDKKSVLGSHGSPWTGSGGPKLTSGRSEMSVVKDDSVPESL